MKTEKGFTLIELAVATALVSLIALGAGMSIVQVFKVSRQNIDSSQAVRQAQFAGYWISEDAVMAEGILSDDPGTSQTEFISMAWSEWETGATHKIDYWLSSAANSLYKIVRTATVYDREGKQAAKAETVIAESIESVTAGWQANGTWKLVVSARSGTQVASREYQICPRINY